RVLPRRPHRPLGGRRLIQTRRHGDAGIVHDLLHLDARARATRAGGGGTARRRQRRRLLRRRSPRGDPRLAARSGAVNDDCLKLTVYFGESDRLDGQLLSDALLDLFAQHRLHAAVLMRAVEGFGIKHTLRTDRFLTLSEDLPLVAVAVDERERIEALLPQVTELVGGGLVTLERARLLHDGLDSVELPEELNEATKLTLYLGRDERIGRRPAFLEVVDRLHAQGLAGATVLLGADGMAHRERRRARFFSRNDAVPLMVISIGSGETIARALPLLDELLTDPIVTLERVRVCKRDGELFAEP